jgi:hypothetical protein
MMPLLLLLLLLLLSLQIAATTIGAPITSMLAVQVAGATIGNMICINNILVRRNILVQLFYTNPWPVENTVLVASYGLFTTIAAILTKAVLIATIHSIRRKRALHSKWLLELKRAPSSTPNCCGT